MNYFHGRQQAKNIDRCLQALSGPNAGVVKDKLLALTAVNSIAEKSESCDLFGREAFCVAEDSWESVLLQKLGASQLGVNEDGDLFLRQGTLENILFIQAEIQDHQDIRRYVTNEQFCIVQISKDNI
jgi:hypothetical protein